MCSKSFSKKNHERSPAVDERAREREREREREYTFLIAAAFVVVYLLACLFVCHSLAYVDIKRPAVFQLINK